MKKLVLLFGIAVATVAMAQQNYGASKPGKVAFGSTTAQSAHWMAQVDDNNPCKTCHD